MSVWPSSEALNFGLMKLFQCNSGFYWSELKCPGVLHCQLSSTAALEGRVKFSEIGEV
jgi:hypothetical protein